jgi:hypothetical protein
LAEELRGCESWLLELPYQDFDRLAETVICADLVCILQDPASDISTYQIPAKITDAIALGVPCLARRLPSLESLIDADAIDVLDPDDSVTDAIARVLSDPHAARERALARRSVFLESYSYAAVRPIIQREVEEALHRPTALHPEFDELLAFHRSGFATSVLPRVRRAEEAEKAAAVANGEVERLVTELRREITALGTAIARRAEVEAIREMVSSTVRPNATVLVVSKGDPDLVRLGSCNSRHFPSDELGDYLGYHPERSEDAILHLQQQRVAGAEYFVLPKSAFWWRNQYPGFWRYLTEECTLLQHDDKVGAIFATTFGSTNSHRQLNDSGGTL